MSGKVKILVGLLPKFPRPSSCLLCHLHRGHRQSRYNHEGKLHYYKMSRQIEEYKHIRYAGRAG